MDRPNETSEPTAATEPAREPQEITRRPLDRAIVGEAYDYGAAAPPQPLPPRAFLQSVATELEPPLWSGNNPDGPDAVAAALSEIVAEASTRSMSAAGPEFAANTAPLATANRSSSALASLDIEPKRQFVPGVGPLVADPLYRSDARNEFARVADTNPEPKPNQSYGGLIKRVGRIAVLVAGGWLAVVLALMIVYRFVNPPVSALMLQKWLFGQEVAHQWVGIENMSPQIVRAVLLSEDGRFCEHYGVDYEAIEDAVERAGSGTPRGASTISMQVVKNLFLWPSKSYLRKAIELPLTYVMEFFWSKRRIMEVYLNIAEWGPGVFGVETAARLHFNKTAKTLGERESARLAVALPNPFLRNPARPGTGTQRLAGAVQVRMRLAPASQTACVLPKRVL